MSAALHKRLLYRSRILQSREKKGVAEYQLTAALSCLRLVPAVPTGAVLQLCSQRALCPPPYDQRLSVIW
jgi:hypothetical protein